MSCLFRKPQSKYCLYIFAVLPDMTDKGFVIDDDVMKELKSDPVVWHNFCRLPELYKRVRIDTIQIKKRQPELFRKRLDKFI